MMKYGTYLFIRHLPVLVTVQFTIRVGRALQTHHFVTEITIFCIRGLLNVEGAILILLGDTVPARTSRFVWFAVAILTKPRDCTAHCAGVLDAATTTQNCTEAINISGST